MEKFGKHLDKEPVEGKDDARHTSMKGCNKK